MKLQKEIKQEIMTSIVCQYRQTPKARNLLHPADIIHMVQEELEYYMQNEGIYNKDLFKIYAKDIQIISRILCDVFCI